ncbi:hypothetical protein D9M69_652040 [compost metagenome]
MPGKNAKLAALVVALPTSSVWPSGLDRATLAAAMAPLAPGLFSTTTGTPRLSCRLLPTRRVTMSVPLPAPKGTTRVMGLAG